MYKIPSYNIGDRVYFLSKSNSICKCKIIEGYKNANDDFYYKVEYYDQIIVNSNNQIVDTVHMIAYAKESELFIKI